MGIHIPWNLFKQLLQDQISDDNRKILMQWKDLAEVNRHIFDEIVNDEIFKNILLSKKWEDTSLQWNKLLDEIKPVKRDLIISKRKLYSIAGMAASLILILGLGLGVWFLQSRTPDTGYTYIYSPRGQHTQVVLPDSTRVWLNSETSLRYPAAFNKKTREVTIEGEAFFKVKKNPKVPFFVNTSDLKVKVYGTSFNVKAYPTDKVIETTLIEGKLSVIPNIWKSDADNEIFLKPKDRLTFKRPNFVDTATIVSVEADRAKLKSKTTKDRKEATPQLILARNVNSDRENLWKDGKLLFKDEKFCDLAIKLERWYDVKIYFEDEKIKNFRFSGKLDKETINQAMDALLLSSRHSYKYRMVFRDIYLESK